jgi:hypothetical protein
MLSLMVATLPHTLPKQVFLCCALFALAAFSSVSAQHSKSAVFTDKQLTVKGDKKDGSFEASFPTKECTKACTETCKDETKEECSPVTVKKCKKTPLEVEVSMEGPTLIYSMPPCTWPHTIWLMQQSSQDSMLHTLECHPSKHF